MSLREDRWPKLRRIAGISPNVRLNSISRSPLVKSVTCGSNRSDPTMSLVDCQFREVGGELTMGLLIGAGILSVCILVTWLILRRPVRQIVEDVHVERARDSVPPAARMAGSPIHLGPEPIRPVEGQRWEDAQWQDEVLWARPSDSPFAGAGLRRVRARSVRPVSRAQARDGALRVSQGELDVRGQADRRGAPDEAVGRNQRFEAVVVPQPHPRRVG